MDGVRSEGKDSACRLTNVIENNRVNDGNQIQWNDKSSDHGVERRREDFTRRNAETRFRFEFVTVTNEQRYGRNGETDRPGAENHQRMNSSRHQTFVAIGNRHE